MDHYCTVEYSSHVIVHDEPQRECQPCQYIDSCTHYSQLQRARERESEGERESILKEVLPPLSTSQPCLILLPPNSSLSHHITFNTSSGIATNQICNNLYHLSAAVPEGCTTLYHKSTTLLSIELHIHCIYTAKLAMHTILRDTFSIDYTQV